MDNETLPTQEFNLSLPNQEDDGKVSVFIKPLKPSQTLIDALKDNHPDLEIGISVDF